jgi:glycosyltransferase involved in cell wall biosynthesis
MLAFGAGTWRWPEVFGSPRYHLWALAARGWRVVYVEPPARAPRPAPRWWSAPDRPFHVLSPALVPPVAPRLLPAGVMAAALRRMVAWRLAGGANAALRRHDMGPPDAVWLGAPWMEPLADWLPPGCPIIHHVYDELAMSPALSPAQQRQLAAWEADLLDRAALVACSSMPQLEARRAPGRELLLLENAIPDDFIAPPGATPPPEARPMLAALAALPRPVFAYGGVADHRLDPAWFAALVNGLGSGSLAILGKLDPSIDPPLAALFRDHPRVWVTGHVPHAHYPFLYRAVDCLVMAHREHPFTAGMYPEKMNEYLASGRPIVARHLAEVARLAAEAGAPSAIRIVYDMNRFVVACHEAVGDESPEVANARRAIAAQRTWSTTAERLDVAVRALIHRLEG